MLSVLPPFDGALLLLLPPPPEVGTVTVSVLVLGPSDGAVDDPLPLVLLPVWGSVAEDPVVTLEESDTRLEDSDKLDGMVAVEVTTEVRVMVVSVSLLVMVVP